MRILVVDDEKLLVKGVKFNLENEGYEVECAYDGASAVELARKAGAFVFGICNVVGSSIARATDSGAYIHVGPEIGVASTKAFTGQVTVLTMLALMIARVKGTIDQECSRKIAKHLLDLPAVAIPACMTAIKKRREFKQNLLEAGEEA